MPPARRLLARRKGVLARLAPWSAAEAGQAFVVGYGVAHAVDQGFDRGVTAGALLGAFTCLAQSLLPAVHTLMTALGKAGSRLLVVVDRIAGPASQAPACPAGRPPAAGAVPSAADAVWPARSGTSAVTGSGTSVPRSADAARSGPSTALRSAAAVEFRAVPLSYGVRGARPRGKGEDRQGREGRARAVPAGRGGRHAPGRRVGALAGAPRGPARGSADHAAERRGRVLPSGRRPAGKSRRQHGVKATGPPCGVGVPRPPRTGQSTAGPAFSVPDSRARNR
ncbi:hypothetical protein GCM10010398_57810 [Streptomyces fimbriatus]